MRREIRQHIPLEVFRQVVLSTQGVIFAKILVHNLEQIKQHIIRYGLTRSVCLIRQAVGDAGHQQHVIKTLRGYGYRFMADMTLHPAEAIRGWALSAQGQRSEGIAQLRKGLAAYRSTGAVVFAI